MFVSRSEVSLRLLIQAESAVTLAKAMSSSFDGKGPGSALLSKNWPRGGSCCVPGKTGSQRDHGETGSGIATLRGPTRRSYTAAIDTRQLAAHSASSSVL